MTIRYLPLSEIFEEIIQGYFHAVEDTLDVGTIPLVSCTSTNNGIKGYYDIPQDKQFKNCVTIASNGLPLTSFYHPYTFSADDDILIGIPKPKLKLSTIYYTVEYLNKLRWRFSYGRKCYKNKINKITIGFPANGDHIDENLIAETLNISITNRLPKKNSQEKLSMTIKFQLYRITNIFDIQRGDFHALDKLDEGNIPTISRTSNNNGVVGYFEKPDAAKIYEPGLLTVSTVSGDTFIQYSPFIATDNILICRPKINLRKTTLLFIQFMMNREKWRYSYGRQCYKTKFEQSSTILLPSTQEGKIDEDIIETIVKNTLYWNYVNEFSNFRHNHNK